MRGVLPGARHPLGVRPGARHAACDLLPLSPGDSQPAADRPRSLQSFPVGKLRELCRGVHDGRGGFRSAGRPSRGGGRGGGRGHRFRRLRSNPSAGVWIRSVARHSDQPAVRTHVPPAGSDRRKDPVCGRTGPREYRDTALHRQPRCPVQQPLLDRVLHGVVEVLPHGQVEKAPR